MKYSKTALTSPFSVHTAITFYHIDLADTQPRGDWHPFPEFIYVDKGEQRVLVDGELFFLREGQAVFYPPNAYHIGASVSRAIVDVVTFETDFSHLSSLYNRVITLDSSERRLLSQVMRLGLANFKNNSPQTEQMGLMAKEDASSLDLMALKNYLELLLISLYQKLDRGEEALPSAPIASNRANFKEEQFFAVAKYLKKNLHRVLTLEEISSANRISVSQLKYIFRSQIGCGPLSYFLSLKIGEAKHLITDTSLNFTEIADRLGFSSIHYFSKLFKEKTGLTPTEYAKTVNKA